MAKYAGDYDRIELTLKIEEVINSVNYRLPSVESLEIVCTRFTKLDRNDIEGIKILHLISQLPNTNFPL